LLCRETLTDYMIPRHFMSLVEIPLSSNGKVDRSRLPAPASLSGATVSDYTAHAVISPVSDVEQKVLVIFADVLKVSPDSICCAKDSFFRLGGNSVTAIQLIFRLRDTLGSSIGVQDLFQYPTVRGICGNMTTQQSTKVDPASFDIIRLHEGIGSVAPLVLFNPAGASVLRYVDLF